MTWSNSALIRLLDAGKLSKSEKKKSADNGVRYKRGKNGKRTFHGTKLLKHTQHPDSMFS